MEWNAETGKSKFLVQPKFLEPKEILVDILGEIASNELLASVVERIRTIPAGIVEGRAEQLCQVGSQAFMDSSKLRSKPLYIIFDIRLQRFDIRSNGSEGVKDDLLLGVCRLELGC